MSGVCSSSSSDDDGKFFDMLFQTVEEKKRSPNENEIRSLLKRRREFNFVPQNLEGTGAYVDYDQQVQDANTLNADDWIPEKQPRLEIPAQDYRSELKVYVGSSPESSDEEQKKPKKKRGKKKRKRKSLSEKGKQHRERFLREHAHRVPCSYFKLGKCFKGTNCLYSHALPSKIKVLCKHYVNKSCIKGEDCPFMHSEFPCMYFHTNRRCYARHECRYSHEPLTEQMKQVLFKYLNPPQRQADKGEPPEKRPCLLGDAPQELEDAVETSNWRKENSELIVEVPPLRKGGNGSGESSVPPKFSFYKDTLLTSSDTSNNHHLLDPSNNLLYVNDDRLLNVSNNSFNRGILQSTSDTGYDSQLLNDSENLFRSFQFGEESCVDVKPKVEVKTDEDDDELNLKICLSDDISSNASSSNSFPSVGERNFLDRFKNGNNATRVKVKTKDASDEDIISGNKKNRTTASSLEDNTTSVRVKTEDSDVGVIISDNGSEAGSSAVENNVTAVRVEMEDLSVVDPLVGIISDNNAQETALDNAPSVRVKTEDSDTDIIVDNRYETELSFAENNATTVRVKTEDSSNIGGTASSLDQDNTTTVGVKTEDSDVDIIDCSRDETGLSVENNAPSVKVKTEDSSDIDIIIDNNGSKTGFSPVENNASTVRVKTEDSSNIGIIGDDHGNGTGLSFQNNASTVSAMTEDSSNIAITSDDEGDSSLVIAIRANEFESPQGNGEELGIVLRTPESNSLSSPGANALWDFGIQSENSPMKQQPSNPKIASRNESAKSITTKPGDKFNAFCSLNNSTYNSLPIYCSPNNGSTTSLCPTGSDEFSGVKIKTEPMEERAEALTYAHFEESRPHLQMTEPKEEEVDRGTTLDSSSQTQKRLQTRNPFPFQPFVRQEDKDDFEEPPCSKEADSRLSDSEMEIALNTCLKECDEAISKLSDSSPSLKPCKQVHPEISPSANQITSISLETNVTTTPENDVTTIQGEGLRDCVIKNANSKRSSKPAQSNKIVTVKKNKRNASNKKKKLKKANAQNIMLNHPTSIKVNELTSMTELMIHIDIQLVDEMNFSAVEKERKLTYYNGLLKRIEKIRDSQGRKRSVPQSEIKNQNRNCFETSAPQTPPQLTKQQSSLTDLASCDNVPLPVSTTTSYYPDVHQFLKQTPIKGVKSISLNQPKYPDASIESLRPSNESSDSRIAAPKLSLPSRQLLLKECVKFEQSKESNNFSHDSNMYHNQSIPSNTPKYSPLRLEANSMPSSVLSSPMNCSFTLKSSETSVQNTIQPHKNQEDGRFPRCEKTPERGKPHPSPNRIATLQMGRHGSSPTSDTTSRDVLQISPMSPSRYSLRSRCLPLKTAPADQSPGHSKKTSKPAAGDNETLGMSFTWSNSSMNAALPRTQLGLNPKLSASAGARATNASSGSRSSGRLSLNPSSLPERDADPVRPLQTRCLPASHLPRAISDPRMTRLCQERSVRIKVNQNKVPK